MSVHRRCTFLAMLWCLLTLVGTSLPAEETASLPLQLAADAADGRLDQFSLLDATLVASGVTEPERLAECQRRYETLRQQAAEELKECSTPRAKANRLHRTLHRNLLAGNYRADCNEIATSLTTGDFNCLTATVLYNCLAADFDLPAVAMETTGHIRTRLKLQPPIDVETTCAEWFEVLNNPSLLSRYAAGLPARRQLKGEVRFRPIEEIELVARIYYNRGVARLHAAEYSEAVELTRASLRIDPDHDIAQGNLLAGLNNWALAECKAGRYAAAAAHLKELRKLDPSYGPLAGNDLHLHQQWVQALLAKHEYAQAHDILAAGYARRPDVQLFDLGRFSVYRQWVAWHLAVGRTVAALEVCADAQQRYPSRAEALDLEAGAIIDQAIQLLEADRREEAVALLDLGLERQPEHALLNINRQLLKDVQRSR